MKLKNEGVSIIYISHRLHEIGGIADRITVLRDGELVGTVNKDEVTMDEVLAMIIIGKLPQDVTQSELADLRG